MAVPVANFDFTPAGLSLSFRDSSSGVPTSWSWNFKNSAGTSISTSTSQNPTYVFPANGVYTVELIASNADGNSVMYSLDLIVNSNPTISLTIAEMAQFDIPAPLSIKTPYFRNLVQKWQLYVWNYFKATIAYSDVFDETKYPAIANVLISKLVVYDYILNAATSAATAYAAAQQLFNGLQTTTTNTYKVADFSAPLSTVLIPDFNAGDTVKVNGIIVNGVSSAASGNLTSWIAVQDYLNGLGYGHFTYFVDGSNNRHIRSYGNSNILTTISLDYTISSVVTNYLGNFSASNAQIVPVTQAVTIDEDANAAGMMPGPLKELTTGPSTSQWYDSSSFWETFFKDKGIMDEFKKQICMLAGVLRIRLSICPPLPKTELPMFINTTDTSGSCCDWPASRGWAGHALLLSYTDCLNTFYSYALSHYHI